MNKAQKAAYNKEYYSRPEVKEKVRLYYTSRRKIRARYYQIVNAKNKLKALRHYGGLIPRCRRCGICDVRFLVLDHVNGDGHESRKKLGRLGSRYYAYLIKTGFQDKLQVLCYHCNHRKERKYS